MDFCIIFKSIWGTIVTMSRIYTGRSGVQILAEARELSLLQNIQTTSSHHPASNSTKTTAFFLAVKVARTHSLTTIICLEPSLQISGAIPPRNLSASLTQSGTTLFYLYLLTVYIHVSRHHILSGLIKELFYTLLTSYMHTT